MKPGIRYIVEGIRRAQFGMRPLKGAFGVGVVQPDGAVAEFGCEGRAWPDVTAFHRARGRLEAVLLEHHAGAGRGYFGTGVVLSGGSVAELGGKRRAWPSPEAFLEAAGGMDADLVRWCPPQ